MNKLALLEEVYNSAFNDELQKLAMKLPPLKADSSPALKKLWAMVLGGSVKDAKKITPGFTSLDIKDLKLSMKGPKTKHKPLPEIGGDDPIRE